MFLHVELHVEKENDSQIEELIKENESIAKKLVDVENALGYCKYREYCRRQH